MRKRAILLTILVLLALLAFATATLAQTGYDLSWWTVDGGGGTSSAAGGYSLVGTVGQPDAGLLSGGSYTLAGGFWGGGADQYRLYLPLVLRNS